MVTEQDTEKAAEAERKKELGEENKQWKDYANALLIAMPVLIAALSFKQSTNGVAIVSALAGVVGIILTALWYGRDRNCYQWVPKNKYKYPSLEWAMRRYIYKQLVYGERRPPMERRALKSKLRSKQKDLCPLCGEVLPTKGAVLDRLEAMKGYTEENTRLLCSTCDATVQEQRHYA